MVGFHWRVKEKLHGSQEVFKLRHDSLISKQNLLRSTSMKLANIDLQNSMYQSDSGIPQTVELSQNNTISGDTFHNAFFESYWNKYSSVKEVSLTISFQGEIDLQIFCMASLIMKSLQHLTIVLILSVTGSWTKG